MIDVLKNLGRKISKSRFILDVVLLGGGTAIAQVIMIAILPILTRLYTPENFGVFTLYLSILLVLSIFSSLGYEQLILQQKSKKAALQLVWVIVMTSTTLATLTFFIALFFRHIIAQWLGTPEIAPWLFTLPLSLMLMGLYNAFRYWNLRLENFGAISQSMIGRAAGFTTVTVLTKTPVTLLPQSSGLILGHIFGSFAMFFVLFYRNWKRGEIDLSRPKLSRVVAMAKRHRAMAATLTASDGLAHGYYQMPNFLISSSFGAAALGFVGLAERIIEAPSVLVSGAIANVYQQRAAQAYRDKGEFYDLTVKTLQITVLIGIMPYLIGIIYAPEIFAFVFGPDWMDAGRYASVMLVGSFFTFIATTHKAAVITNAKSKLLYFYSLRFTSVLMACLAVPLLGLKIITFLALLALIKAVFLLYMIALSLKLSKGTVGAVPA